jgi:hypothetical protein
MHVLAQELDHPGIDQTPEEEEIFIQDTEYSDDPEGN